MKDKQKAEFAKILKGFLYAVNGTHSPDPEIIRSYWVVLADYELDAVRPALDALLKTADEHVTPRDIVRQIAGESKAEPAKAWRLYNSLVQTRGVKGTKSTDCEDVRAQAALIAIGGSAALNVEPARLKDTKAKFFEEYAAH